jgi:hypothetical protein
MTSSFQPVADLLVKEGLLLTALELHAELSEKGRGLRDGIHQYFYNFSIFFLSFF